MSVISARSQRMVRRKALNEQFPSLQDPTTVIAVIDRELQSNVVAMQEDYLPEFVPVAAATTRVVLPTISTTPSFMIRLKHSSVALSHALSTPGCEYSTCIVGMVNILHGEAKPKPQFTGLPPSTLIEHIQQQSITNALGWSSVIGPSNRFVQSHHHLLDYSLVDSSDNFSPVSVWYHIIPDTENLKVYDDIIRSRCPQPNHIS